MHTNGGLSPVGRIDVAKVRDAVLAALAARYETWREHGFAALHPLISAIDCLRGRAVSVLQTDGDRAPTTGPCGGIAADGSLLVGGSRIYAGEAHLDFQYASGPRDPGKAGSDNGDMI